MAKFIGGFILFGVCAGIIWGVGLWLLSLIISVISFNWTFVLVISGIAGFAGGMYFALE